MFILFINNIEILQANSPRNKLQNNNCFIFNSNVWLKKQTMDQNRGIAGAK